MKYLKYRVYMKYLKWKVRAEKHEFFLYPKSFLMQSQTIIQDNN